MEFGFPELAAIRLGFGLSPNTRPPSDIDGVLASVAAAAPGPEAMSTDFAREGARQLSAIAKARVDGDDQTQKAYVEVGRELRNARLIGLQHRIARAVEAPAGFGERLVQFWADHFTIRADGTGAQRLAVAFVDEAIRPNIGGRFEDLLFAADTHPMMLIYLNQNVSVGPNSVLRKRDPKRERGLNENLAREILELHTLGVGAEYSQQDVRQLAELLTGLTYSTANDVVFRPQMAEPGAETVLGKDYGGGKNPSIEDVRAVLTDIARRKDTAAHVSRKLAVHFISDEPDDALVTAMTDTWLKTDGDLAQVYRTMISNAALVDSFRQKVRQPYDYIVTCLRALGVTGDEVRAWERRDINSYVVAPLVQMGQPWGLPLGPNGWPEEAEAWITPQSLAARISWATKFPSRLRKELPDPRGLLDTALGGTQSEALAWAVPKAESVREGVALILASNDFNRR